MYERRIENSMFKTMAELLRLRLMRELEQANADDEELTADTYPPQDQKVNYAKQSQFAPAKTGVSSFVGEDYENKSRRGLRENKANQSQYIDRRQMSEDGRQTTDDRRQTALLFNC